jgi:hypothetical protein
VSEAVREVAGRQAARAASGRPVTLVELIDRLLADGVAIEGQIVLAVADIDLVQLDLGVLLAAVTEAPAR